MQAAAKETGEITEHKQTQLPFLDCIQRVHGEEQHTALPQAISTALDVPLDWRHWVPPRIYRFAMEWEPGKKGPEIRVELDIHDQNAKQRFAALEKRRDEIERACGVPLKWHNPERKNACRIFTRQGADFLREDLWPQQHHWLKEKLELFYKVFAPIVQNLDAEEDSQATVAGA